MARVSLMIVDAAQAYAEIVGYVLTTYYPDSIALAGLAHAPAAALELAHSARPQIALLDFHDPGLGLIDELQAALGHGRIIILGSDDNGHYETLATAAGAAAYLPKSAINSCLLPLARRLAGAEPPPQAVEPLRRPDVAALPAAG